MLSGALHRGRLSLLSAKPRFTVAARYQSQAAAASGHRLYLRQGEVHIWWLPSAQVSEDPALLRRYRRLLTEQELAVVEAGSSAAVAHQRLLARALVRCTLARYSGIPAAHEVRLAVGAHGKPYLQNGSHAGQALEFNLCHTETLLGCAVSVGSAVGLDVERSDREPSSALKLAKRRFSPEEYQQLTAEPDPQRRAQLFVQLWTLKEAFVKARGTGISAPPGLKGFSIGLHDTACPQHCLASINAQVPSAAPPVRISLSSTHVDPHDYQLLLLEPQPGHTAALCRQLRPCQAQGLGHEQAQEQRSKQVALTMWETVPLEGERPLNGTGLVLGCTPLPT